MTFSSAYDLFEFSFLKSISQSPGVQSGSALVALGNGTSAVFYYDLAAGEIAARLVAADGSVGARVVASSGSIDTQNTPSGHFAPVSVARLTNGNIVLTWASNEPTKNIYYRIFDAGLNPLTPATLAETAGINGVRPDVAALTGGGFVIVWEKQYSATDSDPVYIRFDPNGTPLDSTLGIAIDGSSASIDESPSVAGLADGGFAVGWDRFLITGNTATAMAIYNANGTVRVAAHFEDFLGTINRDVDLVARNDGGFSMYYEDSAWGPGNAITGLNFSAAGVFQSQVQASQTGSSDAAAAVSSEGFVMLTETLNYSNFPTIYGSILAPDGSLLTSDISLGLINAEQISSLAWLDAATLRVAFNGYGIGYGDDLSSVNSKTFHLFRTTTGDGANDVIDFSASAVWNVVHGGDGDDTITGGPGDDRLYGENNNDTLIGGAGNDYLQGGNGTNVLLGGDGNDQVNAGSGADTLSGGDGDDNISLSNTGSSPFVDGGPGIDTLQVVYPSELLGSLSGIERVQMFPGSSITLTGSQFATGLALNTVVSGPGSLIVNMTAGVAFVSKFFTFTGTTTVVVNGTAGTDVFKLGNALHTINAGDGNDGIKGGTAADTINGGNGIDKINGNGGADILTGGAGADVFKYANTTDSGLGVNADKITDFLSGTDRLNFVRIDADALTAGDQAFSFIDTAAFTNTGLGQIRWVDLGADLRVEVDVDGNGTADMHILLQGAGAQVLTAADFVL